MTDDRRHMFYGCTDADETIISETRDREEVYRIQDMGYGMHCTVREQEQPTRQAHGLGCRTSGLRGTPSPSQRRRRWCRSYSRYSCTLCGAFLTEMDTEARWNSLGLEIAGQKVGAT